MTTFHALSTIDLRDRSDEARSAFRSRCQRSAGVGGAVDDAVRPIVQAVAERGDAAVAECIARFEGREPPTRFEIDRDERASAAARVDATVREALAFAAERVRSFHETQRPQSSGCDDAEGRLTSRVSPLSRVAVYAPGGTAAYPSSVLMTAIPAKVAGVDEVILFTPRPSDVVLLAAELAHVDRVFAVGGAQAIAAAAYGTETIPKVDKIVGPGNAYVTAAKRQVFGLVDIDSIAGPSEIMILADEHASPDLVAADLLSQAEHDVLACPILVTTSPALLAAVDAALRDRLASLPRRDIANQSLCEQGAAIVVNDRQGLVEVANAYAPEHLELLVEHPRELVPRLRTAGAIFVGPYTPEAAGDYTAGPSHVLPTAGAARFSSPLGVWDFVKYTSVLELSAVGLAKQADAIVALARAEGLEAHARAVLARSGGAT